MSLIPAFEIGLGNAWVLMLPYFLATYGLSYLIVNKKSALFSWPPYNKKEKRALPVIMAAPFVLGVYSIFLPIKLGTAWFYAGFIVYLLGMIFDTVATLNFAATPVDKPNTQGIYCLSRNPIYLGFLLIYIGTGIACTSWIFLLIALVFFLVLHYVLIASEERFCLEKFGSTYQEYMDRTPKWIGIRKLGKK